MKQIKIFSITNFRKLRKDISEFGTRERFVIDEKIRSTDNIDVHIVRKFKENYFLSALITYEKTKERLFIEDGFLKFQREIEK